MLGTEHDPEETGWILKAIPLGSADDEELDSVDAWSPYTRFG